MVDGLGKSGRFDIGDREMRLLLLLLMAVPCAAEEIPLSEVWGFQTPGTKNISALDPDSRGVTLPGELPTKAVERFRGSLVQRIASSLARERTIDRAFVVNGIGKEALQSAADVLLGKAVPLETIQPNEPFTVVAFSTLASDSIRLRAVDLSKNRHLITLTYSIEPRQTMNLTSSYVLIPIEGGTEAGDFSIEIATLSDAYSQKELSLRNGRYICHFGKVKIATPE
jgi:hypothetical protein